jgi:ABC-2 type transport system permease protein
MNCRRLSLLYGPADITRLLLNILLLKEMQHSNSSKRMRLLLPFFCSARNRFFPRKRLPLRTIGVLVFSLAVCAALYIFGVRVVTYFHSQNELGIILSLKIFQMAWITMFAMLIFSCMVSAVSTLFLSQDNEIIFAAPVATPDIFFMRYLTTSIYTSWMMIVFSIPIFAAYGTVFAAGILYWPLMFVTIIATAGIATSFGMGLTVVLVNLFPARRTKDIILYLSVCFGIFIYLIFRLMRPEDLVNPDKYGHFVDYLSSIATPAAPYIPAAWASNLLSYYLMDREIDFLVLALLCVTPVVLFFLDEWTMERWFLKGFTKSQESFGGYRKFFSRGRYRRNALQWIFRKEAKLFLRDSAEWSQLFMIAALVVVYLYNFKVLPVERSIFEEEYVTNLISFLNIGLTGFVIASLAARFVYPSIGAEGGSFYLIISSPLTTARYILYKYVFYVVPFTGLALILLVVSNRLLNIEGPMWWISVTTGLLITWTVLAMAFGFGAIYADFKAENRAAALGGIGAILFLFTAIAFEMAIIFLGGSPVYKVMRGWLRHGIMPFDDLLILIGWILASVSLSLFLSFFFIRKGIKKLETSGG